MSESKVVWGKERWVLTIGTGPSQAPLIEAARQRGYSIIGVDRSPNSNLVDIAIPISTHSTDEVINKLENTNEYPKFEGVLCRSSGPAVETAATVAEKYSLPTAGLKVARCSVSKWGLFNWASHYGLPTIPTLRCTELTTIPATWNAVVIKPAMPVYGKKNVFLIRETDQMGPAINSACEESLDGYSIVQPFVLGEDVGLVALSREGKLIWSTTVLVPSSYGGHYAIIDEALSMGVPSKNIVQLYSYLKGRKVVGRIDLSSAK